MARQAREKVEKERFAKEQAEKERLANEQKAKELATKESIEREKREKQKQLARKNAEILRKANDMEDLEKYFNSNYLFLFMDGYQEKELKIYSDAAELGDACAQTNVGILWSQGFWGKDEVKRDYSEAIKWFRKAANQGYAKAQNCMGVMYQRGHGVAKNDSLSLMWFRKAAEQNNPFGQYNLARMYQYKEKYRDFPKAKVWYEKAAEQGHFKAKFYKENVYKYVDLGLPSGTLWATCNLDSYHPEILGASYRWGETEWVAYNGEYLSNEIGQAHKKRYKWKNDNYYTKYNLQDAKIELDLEDDAAFINWGTEWRIPSFDQVKELIQECKWESAEKGYKVIGKNGNSIFLPSGQLYMSRSLSKSKKEKWGCYVLDPSRSKYYKTKPNSRTYLYQIRPVRMK